MTYNELRKKEVINVRDCKKLGHICDLELDECSGQIHKIIVPGCNKWLNLINCENSIAICYKDICQIGPEVILVNI
ncbi:MAG: YlmC/YmxH family sporulation protein [Lachnospiraceae bacterium]|nr:YlmC/YmxH family sporulation protein [Lachnospiraceae bacterium]